MQNVIKSAKFIVTPNSNALLGSYFSLHLFISTLFRQAGNWTGGTSKKIGKIEKKYKIG